MMSQPLLPGCWQSSYVSYYEPMRPDDPMTNGYAWFDYERGVSRIDGFVNPWDEEAMGYRLWVSEVNWFGARCHRVRMAYTRSPEGVAVRRLADLELDSPGPAIAQNILRAGDARQLEPLLLMGREAIPWHVTAPRATTLYLCARTALLLRIKVEKQPGQTSVRDFVTVEAHPIAPSLFDRAAWAEVMP